MGRRPISESKRHKIIMLSMVILPNRKKMSARKIARQVQVDVKTVLKYLSTIEK